MSPVRMEQLTGLKLEALRPSDRPLFWRAGGVVLCGVQYFIGEALGLDPVTTTIPLTFAALAADQVYLVYSYTVNTTFIRSLTHSHIHTCIGVAKGCNI